MVIGWGGGFDIITESVIFIYCVCFVKYRGWGGGIKYYLSSQFGVGVGARGGDVLLQNRIMLSVKWSKLIFQKSFPHTLIFPVRKVSFNRNI